MKYLLIFVLAVMLFGCSAEKKAQKQKEKTQLYLINNPGFSAGYCAEQFPNKDSVVEVINIDSSEGYTVITVASKPDTVYLDDSTMVINTKDTVYKTKIKVITITKDSIIYRTNTAEEAKLKFDLNKCQETNVDLVKMHIDQEKTIAYWKGKARTRWWWIAFLIGGAAAYTVFKVWKRKLPFT